MSASAARADSSGEVPADDAPADDRTHQCLHAAGGAARLVFGSPPTPAGRAGTGGGRVGHGFAVVPRGDASPHLANLVGMERDEAARSPYPLIHPEALEVHALREADPTPGGRTSQCASARMTTPASTAAGVGSASRSACT
ncbi:MAG: hypothetical protein AAF772_07020, partial [Acidobacteriota bacterium]